MTAINAQKRVICLFVSENTDKAHFFRGWAHDCVATCMTVGALMLPNCLWFGLLSEVHMSCPGRTTKKLR
jgi:hypothetical protein